MRKQFRKNLLEVVAMMRENGLFLAVHIYNNHPQLIVCAIDPVKNKNAKAKCFFLLPFMIPSGENKDSIPVPRGIVELNIRPFTNNNIRGIDDRLMNSFSFDLDKNIEKLKQTKKQIKK